MRRWIITLATGALFLGACSSGGGDAVGGEGPTVFAGDSASEAPGLVRGEDGADPDMVEVVATDGRRVIRTAKLEINAADTREAFKTIGDIVESNGGFIARAEVGRVESEDQQPMIVITVRVPSDQLSEILEDIKTVADRVVTESQNSQDVSEQFVDLEARLRNLEALETELRALLTEVRSQPDADPEKLLRVFNELAGVRGQIEQIEGQLEHLTGLTDLATVDITITQTPAVAPIVDQPWTPADTFREAARSLVQALQSVADGLITFAIYVLPVLLLAGVVPALVGWYLWRRYRRRPTPSRPTPPAPAAD